MHRRIIIWPRAGLWGRLHQTILQLLDGQKLVDLSRAVLDSAHVHVGKRGELASPTPWTGGKPGSDMRVLSDADGLPLRVRLSATHTHDSQALKSMLCHFHTGGVRHPAPAAMALGQAHRGPDRTQGIDSSERLGRRRWVIERTMSWLSDYRRLDWTCCSTVMVRNLNFAYRAASSRCKRRSSSPSLAEPALLREAGDRRTTRDRLPNPSADARGRSRRRTAFC